jgi:hypothetical protein
MEVEGKRQHGGGSAYYLQVVGKQAFEAGRRKMVKSNS